MDGKLNEVSLQDSAHNAKSAVGKSWPRISLITSVYNGEKYLEATIRSVLSQEYPNLEYFIMDGASTDGTVDVIRKYESRITGWVSEPDTGVYDSLNKGFGRTTGEIMGWLNCSDMLHTNALFSVAEVFSKFPDARWITGRPVMFGDSGWPGVVTELRRWSRYRFLAGANKHIQQESTYWRRNLWEEAGGALTTEYRAEGDFELWVRFFRYTQLFSVDALIGGWRFHVDTLSHADPQRYDRNCDEIVWRELDAMIKRGESAAFCKFVNFMTKTRFVRGVWNRLVVKALYTMNGGDLPPVLTFPKDQWKMVR